MSFRPAQPATADHSDLCLVLSALVAGSTVVPHVCVVIPYWTDLGTCMFALHGY